MTTIDIDPPLPPPSDPFGTPFEEKGYTFTAFMPISDQEKREFLLKVAIGGVERFTVHIPMLYAPRFGVDVGDQAMLEGVTDALIEALPPAADFTVEVAMAFGVTQQTSDVCVTIPEGS